MQTMIPVPGSPALGAGQVTSFDNPTTDERGFSRLSTTGAAIAVGAVQPNFLIVTTTNDQIDAGPDCTSGTGNTCSLRDALTAANPAGTDVTFASVVTGAIDLSTVNAPLPAIAGPLNLVGPGANNLSVSGGHSSSVGSIFTVNSGVNAALSGITVTAGGDSGLMINGGTLAVSNSTISGNRSMFNGGGINNHGTVMVLNSTISNNSTGYDYGGGLFNEGIATVSGSTISGNDTSYGGGIFSQGPLTVTDSTISGNGAAGGGGLFNGAPATVSNSIVAGNTSPGNPGDDCDNCGTQSNYNLINTTSTSPQINPLLAPLANYGGSTQLQAHSTPSQLVGWNDRRFGYGHGVVGRN